MVDDVYDELLALMQPLALVGQSPKYHPEGDALFHSLQVFDLAIRDSGDPVHWAAALLHDVGKASDTGCHAEYGARLLEGLANERVLWLVAHHLDLLRQPKETKARLVGEPCLRDLTYLRGWDLAGRRCHAIVPTVERALGMLLEPGVAERWLTPLACAEDDFDA